MEFLISVFVVLHLLGMAAIIGSAIFVARGAVTPALVWGARAQLVTGILLVGLREMQDLPVNNIKIAVKLTIALIAAVAAFLAHRRQAKDGKVMPLFHTAGGLGLVNILIAVLW